MADGARLGAGIGETLKQARNGTVRAGSRTQEPRSKQPAFDPNAPDVIPELSTAGSGSEGRGGTGNHPVGTGSGNHREPAGTTLRFEGLDSFIERARTQPPLTYLLPNLVPDRGRLLIVAPPNAGKTWLALALSKAACAAGRAVLFIEEEGSTRKLGERLEAMAFPAEAPLRISHLAGVKLDDTSVRRQLVEQLKASAAPVMVLDPMTSLWSGDENETRDVSRLRGCLDELANANPAALLVVLHHTSKAATNGDGHEINAARGSSVFPAWADVMLNLSHAQGLKDCIALDAKVAKNRDGERGQRVNVRIELGTGAVTIDDAHEPADDLDERILAALKEAPGGLTKNGISKLVKGKKATVLAQVDALAASGLIVLDQKVYRLPGQSESPLAADPENREVTP